VSGETISGGWNFGFTTQDLILLAVIGAISGVINTGMGIVWNAANAAGGPLAGAALQGAFMWAYLLAFFLVKKPGSMLIVGLLETAIEALLGNPSGVATLGWGLMQGLGAEVVMAICSSRFTVWYRLDSIPVWLGYVTSGSGAILDCRPDQFDFRIYYFGFVRIRFRKDDRKDGSSTSCPHEMI